MWSLTLTGGGGPDALAVGPGTDAAAAREGAADRSSNCGGDAGVPDADVVTADASDPVPATPDGCGTVNRG